MKQFFLTLALLAVLGACSKSDPAGGTPEQQDGTSIGNGHHLIMRADLREAKSITTSMGDKSKLLKVTNGGDLKEIFSGEHQVFNWRETPTHIIAQTHIVERVQEKHPEYGYMEWVDKKCFLIAIPKVREETRVLCLNREAPMGWAGDHQKYTKPNFDTRGSEVYFTTLARPGHGYASEDEMYRELRHWDGKSEEVTTLFHSDSDRGNFPVLFRPFTSEANDNVCFATYDSSTYSSNSKTKLEGALFCRSDRESDWRRIPDVHLSYHSMKMGSEILAHQTRVNLDTLEVTRLERQNTLPLTEDYRLFDGGILGTTDNDIICVDREGAGKVVATVDRKKAQLANSGEYVWFIGNNSLKRIDRRDCKVEEKNYFDATRLLLLKDISWTVRGFLRVDGTRGTGLPATSYLTPEGGLLDIQDEEVQIKHPIDIQWEL